MLGEQGIGRAGMSVCSKRSRQLEVNMWSDHGRLSGYVRKF